jgi:hypothetical protein
LKVLSVEQAGDLGEANGRTPAFFPSIRNGGHQSIFVEHCFREARAEHEPALFDYLCGCSWGTTWLTRVLDLEEGLRPTSSFTFVAAANLKLQDDIFSFLTAAIR